MGSAIAVAILLLVAYLFGGYVAGRMARRAGLVNGLAVFVLAVVLVAVVAAIAASQADADTVQANLRNLGIPTTGTEWGKIGSLAGIGSLAAMLVGALVGGVLGERWHTKLTRRAVSDNYGPDHADRQTDHNHNQEVAEGQRRRDGDGAGATRVDRPPPGRPTDQP